MAESRKDQWWWLPILEKGKELASNCLNENPALCGQPFRRVCKKKAAASALVEGR